MGQPYDDAANAERPGVIEAVRKRDLPKVRCHPGPRPPAPGPRPQSPPRPRGGLQASSYGR